MTQQVFYDTLKFFKRGIDMVDYHLDFASVEFGEDTRLQVRPALWRDSTLPPRTNQRDLRQALDNAVDSVKSGLPKGKQS